MGQNASSSASYSPTSFPYELDGRGRQDKVKPSGSRRVSLARKVRSSKKEAPKAIGASSTAAQGSLRSSQKSVTGPKSSQQSPQTSLTNSCSPPPVHVIREGSLSWEDTQQLEAGLGIQVQGVSSIEVLESTREKSPSSSRAASTLNLSKSVTNNLSRGSSAVAAGPSNGGAKHYQRTTTPLSNLSSSATNRKHKSASPSPLASDTVASDEDKGISPSSPMSRWSDSSAGGRTPSNFESFRHVNTLHLTDRLPHLIMRSPKLGSIRASSPVQKSTVGSSSTSGGFAGFRFGREKKASSANSRKKGAIVVVSAQRVGSSRYSILREAAARSAANRKSSVPVGELSPGNPGESKRNERRASRSSIMSGARKASFVYQLPRDSVPTAEEIHIISPKTQFENYSFIGKGEVPTSQTQVPDKQSGDIVATHVPQKAKPSRSTRRSPRRSSRSDALLSFIAASPELTCADPKDPIFAQLGEDTSTPVAPVPSMRRVPEGHPANHHSRFKSYHEKLAILPPIPANAESNVTSSRAEVVPTRRIRRNSSKTLSSTRSSIEGSNLNFMRNNHASELALHPASTRPKSFKHAVAGIRLSVTDLEESKEGQSQEEHQSKVMDIIRQYCTDSSGGSSPNVTATTALATASTTRAANTSPAAEQNRRPLSTETYPRRASFPRSVSCSSTVSPLVRGSRQDSSVSFVFNAPFDMANLPSPRRASEINTNGGDDDLASQSQLNINWDNYSLAAPMRKGHSRPTSSFRGSRCSQYSYCESELFLGAIDAFPSPPSRLSRWQPVCLLTEKELPARPIGDRDSMVSDTSSYSSGSLASSFIIALPERRATVVSIAHGNTGALERSVQIEMDPRSVGKPTYKSLNAEKNEPASPTWSTSHSTAPTFVADVMGPSHDSWSSGVCKTPPPYQASFPINAKGSIPVTVAPSFHSSSTYAPGPLGMVTQVQQRQTTTAEVKSEKATSTNPSPSMSQKAPSFEGFRIQAADPLPLVEISRKPSLVSPLSQPLMRGFFGVFDDGFGQDDVPIPDPIIVSPSTELPEFLTPEAVVLRDFDFTTAESPYPPMVMNTPAMFFRSTGNGMMKSKTPSLLSPLTPDSPPPTTFTHTVTTTATTTPTTAHAQPLAGLGETGFSKISPRAGDSARSFFRNYSMDVGSRVSVTASTAAMGVGSARRETHPTWTPPSLRTEAERREKSLKTLLGVGFSVSAAIDNAVAVGEGGGGGEERIKTTTTTTTKNKTKTTSIVGGKEEGEFGGRRGSQVGPDVSATRLGPPEKRGFNKVEIRHWMLTQRRESGSNAGAVTTTVS